MRNLVKLFGLVAILVLTGCRKDELEPEASPAPQVLSVSDPNENGNGSNFITDSEGNLMDPEGYVVVIQHSTSEVQNGGYIGVVDGIAMYNRNEGGYTIQSSNHTVGNSPYVLKVGENEVYNENQATSHYYDTYYISKETQLKIKVDGNTADYYIYIITTKEFKSDNENQNVVKYIHDGFMFDNEDNNNDFIVNKQGFDLDNLPGGWKPLTFTIDNIFVDGHTYTPSVLTNVTD